MSYENFAYYYDSLMDPQFYEDYYRFIIDHIKGKTILELGCGTGEIAIRLAKADYTVYATDLSKDMLEVARLKALDANVDLLLQRIDMTDFSIQKPLDTILCLCDSLNYITTTNGIKQTFRNVYHSLKNYGTFIFDVHSLHYIDTVLANYHEKEDDDEFYFSWQVEKIATGKVKHEIEIKDKIEKEYVQETHIQQTHNIEVYQRLLEKVGFKNIQIFGDFKEYQESSDRVIFVCEKEK